MSFLLLRSLLQESRPFQHFVNRSTRPIINLKANQTQSHDGISSFTFIPPKIRLACDKRVIGLLETRTYPTYD